MEKLNNTREYFHKIGSICLLLFTSLFCQAQLPLEGIVIDSKGDPILGAFIQIQELEHKTTLSDSLGNFAFSLPKGVYTLEARYIGFKSLTRNVTLNSGQK